MLNGASLRAVDAASWGTQFRRPLYDSYCFSRLPELIGTLLPGSARSPLSDLLLGPLARPYERVILCFIDAFGWRFFERYQDRYPFLSRFARDGMVTKLTSQFPSTTVAHLTAIHTGLPVGQSGLYEWFHYEPRVDAVIAPLLFSYAGDTERETLARSGMRPEDLYPQATIYREFAKRGIASFVLQSKAYTPSAYSDVVHAGARVLPFTDLVDGLTTLRDLVMAHAGPAYYFLYFDRIDAASHRYGVDSPQLVAEMDACFAALETLLHSELQGKLNDALLLLTADHGQVEIDPARAIYVNERLPLLPSWLEADRWGRPLAPVGSPRDLFLHVKEAHLEEAQGVLREEVRGRAEVHLVADLIAQHFFGSEPPSPIFLNRVGNLVILPYRNESTWWRGSGHLVRDYGYHGGLTPEEMEPILLALPYS